MTLDILLTTTHKSVDEIITLVNKLNIKSNVIVGNQFKEKSVNTYFVNDYKITVVNTNEKGCSKNRNHILTYSAADIVLFSDDDEIFTNNYYSIIIDAFENNLEAEAIYFKVDVNKESRPVRMFDSNRKAKWKDISALGVWGLAIKRSTIDKYHLSFDESFGPGSICPMGEDSIYLKDLISRSNKVFTNTMLVAYIEQFQSTWFKGYNKNYFVNLGKATKRIYPRTFLFRVIKNVMYYTTKGFNPFKVWWWMMTRK